MDGNVTAFKQDFEGYSRNFAQFQQADTARYCITYWPLLGQWELQVPKTSRPDPTKNPQYVDKKRAARTKGKLHDKITCTEAGICNF